MYQHTTEYERDWPYDARDIVGDAVEIDLVYRGPFPHRAGELKRAAKEQMRRDFSEQLSRRAEREPQLLAEISSVRDAALRGSRLVPMTGGGPMSGPVLGVEHKGRYFPIVVTGLRNLACHLDVTVLRRQPPGALVHPCDLDNELKLLCDVLRAPKQASETQPAPVRFKKGYQPPPAIKQVRQWTICLLEDDSYITQILIRKNFLDTPKAQGEPQDYAEVHVHATLKATGPSSDWMGEP